MPVYAYKGVTDAGRNTKGFVDADSDRTARAKLRRDGIFLTELTQSGAESLPERKQQPIASRRISLDSFRRISGTDLAIATRQLATLLGAGIPVVEALGALTEQVESARLKSVIGGVRDRVNEGASLADAMAAAGPFETLYVGLVRAGETGGALEQVLERLADYLESQVRTRNKVTATVTYPLAMLVMAGFVVTIVVTVVIPQITQLLEGLNRPLPIYTRLIIDLSTFVSNYWWALLAVLIGGIAVLRTLIQTERGRRRFDAFKLRAPILGKVIRQLSISRFTRTLSTLLAGGIPIVKALDISKHVASNTVIGEAVEEAKEAITEGASISAPLRKSGQFPPLVTHMIEVGERSGELEAMLAKVAETYDEQVENSVTRMTALLEPLLIVVMVGVVLIIVLAVLSPMLELTSAIQ